MKNKDFTKERAEPQERVHSVFTHNNACQARTKVPRLLVHTLLCFGAPRFSLWAKRAQTAASLGGKSAKVPRLDDRQGSRKVL